MQKKTQLWIPTNTLLEHSEKREQQQQQQPPPKGHAHLDLPPPPPPPMRIASSVDRRIIRLLATEAAGHPAPSFDGCRNRNRIRFVLGFGLLGFLFIFFFSLYIERKTNTGSFDDVRFKTTKKQFYVPLLHSIVPDPSQFFCCCCCCCSFFFLFDIKSIPFMNVTTTLLEFISTWYLLTPLQ